MIATKIELRKAAHESGDYEQCVENNYTYLYNAASVANDDDEETLKPYDLRPDQAGRWEKVNELQIVNL
jgi:hypothetical protein